MSDRNIKALRGQIRQIVKEMLPEILAQELVASANKESMTKVETRLNDITKYIKTTLDGIDSRSKEVQAYVVRNSAPAAPVTKS